MAVWSIQTTQAAGPFHAYVGDLGPHHALIAWGTTLGDNTIGRTAPPLPGIELKIAGRTIRPAASYAVVQNLDADTEYPYEVLQNGQTAARGVVRTWPEMADRACFFVIGDWGSGDSKQYGVARAMAEEFERREAAGCPVRFVVSTGDNIYGKRFLFAYSESGASDRDWDLRFFAAYPTLLSRVPFYPVLGNHDGNESENQGDRAVYLDNFFFPGDQPAAWYQFAFGGLVRFYMLDSTENTSFGGPKPQYLEGEAQHAWLKMEIAKGGERWKIPVFHHPMYSAGPRHLSNAQEMTHWMTLFAANSVKVTFSGHEHNFQMSAANAATNGMRMFVSGAGGELRRRNVRNRMRREHIDAWSDQTHFLSVELTRDAMTVMPLGPKPVRPVTPAGGAVDLPIVVRR